MDYEKMDQNAEIIDEFSARLASYADTEITEIAESEVEEAEVEEVNATTYVNNPTINDCLNSDFGSFEEQQIKKMMAVAAIASGSKYSPEKIASEADASVVSIKTAYKVSTGEVDITKSTEVLIDQAAARLDTLIQKKLDMNWVGEKVVDAVAMVYPPASKLKPYVKAVLKKTEPVVRKAISTGISKVASYTKTAVRSISTGIKNAVKFLFA